MLMTCFAFMGAAYHNLPWSQMRAVVAAACMHDFDHTGALGQPATDDTVNINRALEGLAELVHHNPKLLSADELALVSSLIRCTRYPYLTEPADLLEELIRDADMCMPYVSQPTRDKLFNGLRQELAASGRVYTPEAFADGVFAFYSASTRHTAWAKAYAEKHNLERSLQDLSANMRMAECKSSTEGG